MNAESAEKEQHAKSASPPHQYGIADSSEYAISSTAIKVPNTSQYCSKNVSCCASAVSPSLSALSVLRAGYRNPTIVASASKPKPLANTSNEITARPPVTMRLAFLTPIGAAIDEMILYVPD